MFISRERRIGCAEVIKMWFGVKVENLGVLFGTVTISRQADGADSADELISYTRTRVG